MSPSRTRTPGNTHLNPSLIPIPQVKCFTFLQIKLAINIHIGIIMKWEINCLKIKVHWANTPFNNRLMDQYPIQKSFKRPISHFITVQWDKILFIKFDAQVVNHTRIIKDPS